MSKKNMVAVAALLILPTLALAADQELIPSDAVAVSSDGHTAVLANGGAAYVYTLSDAGWTEQQVLHSSAANFGKSLALSADGSTALIGAYGQNGGAGAAYVFTRSGTTWTEQQQLTAADAAPGSHFGYAVALASDGNTALLSAVQKNANAGAAYLFTRTGATWTQQQQLSDPHAAGNNFFGSSVALSADGVSALIGAYGSKTNAGAAYVFTQAGARWRMQQELTPSDAAARSYFGYAVALSGDGVTALVGADQKNNGRGAAYVFTLAGTIWTEQRELTAADASAGSSFGASVALSSDGGTALIGSYGKNANAGAAYVFTRTETSWSESRELTASAATPNGWFGASAALSGDGATALVGSMGKAAHVFALLPNAAGTANPVTATTGSTATTAAGAKVSKTATPESSCSPIVVTSTADSGTGTLRAALASICSGGTVDLSQLPSFSTITLASRIYLNQNVTIQGPPTQALTINGGNATRIFFMQGGTVTISNLTLANGLGQGGSGDNGGGAAGMGGAIFQNGGTLTLTGVALKGNGAAGGSAAAGCCTNGGGGFGGASGDIDDGGSGGDLGGAGGTGGTPCTAGGPGGGGGDNTLSTGTGCAGGFGGGGGYGGGSGGAGGFGGGGGAGNSAGGSGGWGGGTGIYGGSGAGFGGAIFQLTGTLTLNSVGFTNNTTTSQVSTYNPNTPSAAGQAKGGALFVYSGSGATATLNGVSFFASTAANAGQAGTGNSASPYTRGAKCLGNDTVDLCGTAPGTVLTTVSVAVGTDVAGLSFSVDGTAYTSTQTFSWTVGSTHTLTFTSPQTGPAGTQYFFNGWSDGTTGTTDTVSAIASTTAYTAYTHTVYPAVTLGNANVCPGGVAAASCTQSGTATFNFSSGTGDFPASVALGTPVVVTNGLANLDFTLGSGSTCTGSIAAGTTCTVSVNFTPLAPGLRKGAVEVVDANGNVLATQYISGIGVGPAVAFSPGVPSSIANSTVQASTLAVDAAGNSFVTAGPSGKVYKVPPSGCPSAGCATLATGLGFPSGVGVDGAGNVFIADHSNNAVVKIPPAGCAGSACTTVASGLSSALGLAVDGAGNVYVSYGSSVAEISPAGVQTTLLSGQTGRYLAVDTAGNVYVPVTGSGKVIKIPAGGGTTTTVGTGLTNPGGVAVDAAGNIHRRLRREQTVRSAGGRQRAGRPRHRIGRSLLRRA